MLRNFWNYKPVKIQGTPLTRGCLEFFKKRVWLLAIVMIEFCNETERWFILVNKFIGAKDCFVLL